MSQKCETPAGKAGASRDLLGCWSRTIDNLNFHRVQILIAEHATSPDLAAMFAILAFGGAHHG